MKPSPLRLVILGLSITSSWGNGHATTYRSLVRELAARGHQVLFLERNVPWYAANRDLAAPPYGQTILYAGLRELKERFGQAIREADLVMVGSYVPEGIAVGRWVTKTAGGITCFYDIDTPVTVARLEKGDCEYLSLDLVPRYHLYLSFTGGPILERLDHHFGSPCVRPLYCSVDPELYYPQKGKVTWHLGYMGTYCDDRQPMLNRLMLEPARRWPKGRFAIAGPLYPATITWPSNIERIEHLPPAQHCRFYNKQKFTLNLTRVCMVQAGYSPSVRLFEAAACATPIISDYWDGLETLFEPGKEILVARTPEHILAYLHDIPEGERQAIGLRARGRIMAEHTAGHRAVQLESYIREMQTAPKINFIP
ncbi:MAG: glycosyltransferase [bacterium]